MTFFFIRTSIFVLALLNSAFAFRKIRNSVHNSRNNDTRTAATQPDRLPGERRRRRRRDDEGRDKIPIPSQRRRRRDDEGRDKIPIPSQRRRRRDDGGGDKIPIPSQRRRRRRRDEIATPGPTPRSSPRPEPTESPPRPTPPPGQLNVEEKTSGRCRYHVTKKAQCLAAAQQLGADMSKTQVDKDNEGSYWACREKESCGCTISKNSRTIEWWGLPKASWDGTFKKTLECGATVNCVCSLDPPPPKPTPAPLPGGLRVEKRTSGQCKHHVSEEQCLAAAQYIGANASKTEVDIVRKHGCGSRRPCGCTHHRSRNVEWNGLPWGGPDMKTLPCGGDWHCVCALDAQPPATMPPPQTYTPPQADWSTFQSKPIGYKGTTAHDPDSIGWLEKGDWRNAKWDGRIYDPSKMSRDEFLNAICPKKQTLRGLRELFYETKPFADNRNPTTLEVDEWHRVVINHIRALVGRNRTDQKISPDVCIFAGCQWAQERNALDIWDSKYPDGEEDGFGGKMCGPKDGGHCGWLFRPYPEDQKPYLPEGHEICPEFHTAEGVLGSKAKYPWSIKLGDAFCSTLKHEGACGGHLGPFWRRQLFGLAVFDPEPDDEDSYATMRLQWGGRLMPHFNGCED